MLRRFSTGLLFDVFLLSFLGVFVVTSPVFNDLPTGGNVDDHLNVESLKETHFADVMEHNLIDDDDDDPEICLISFDEYPRYDEIMAYLFHVANEYPEFVHLSVEGQTSEGRDLVVVFLGRNKDVNETRVIWIDAGMHAREWISITTALYVIDQLVQVYAQGFNDAVSETVLSINWMIMPLLNPDGYEYSHDDDRMWRKNRSPNNNNDGCVGVDLNRNFDVEGYGVGASSDPCHFSYKGAGRETEAETKVASRLLRSYKNVIRTALSLHSFGSFILTSYGYKSEPPVDHECLINWGQKLADAIYPVNNRRYDVSSAGAWDYLAGGAIDDFSKVVAEVPYVATIELAGDDYGFEMPAEKIRGVGEEIWEGLKVAADEARRMKLGPDPNLKECVTRSEW